MLRVLCLSCVACMLFCVCVCCFPNELCCVYVDFLCCVCVVFLFKCVVCVSFVVDELRVRCRLFSTAFVTCCLVLRCCIVGHNAYI